MNGTSGCMGCPEQTQVKESLQVGPLKALSLGFHAIGREAGRPAGWICRLHNKDMMHSPREGSIGWTWTRTSRSVRTSSRKTDRAVQRWHCWLRTDLLDKMMTGIVVNLSEASRHLLDPFPSHRTITENLAPL